jgi:hypothetical protein
MKLQTRIKSTIGKWLCAVAIAAGLSSITARAQITYTPTLTNVWSIVATNRPDITNGNNMRGIAIDGLTNVLYFTTAGGSNHFSTLSFASGAYLGSGNATGVSGGTLATEQIRVSADGSVYACNLSGSSGSLWQIYKWPSGTDFTTAPAIVCTVTGPSFNWRIGDYWDLRGSGASTEMVAVGSGGTNFTIFRPTDSFATNFTNFTITTPGTANLASGGVTFEGSTNALYMKAAGGKPLYRVAYNPTNLTATTTHIFQMDQSANNGLKYYSVSGLNLLASVCTATTALTNGIQHYAKVLQLNLANSNLTVVLNTPLPTPNFLNGNSLGLVDFSKNYAVFSEPNNGISLFQLTLITNSPPTVSINSGGGTYIAGFTNSIVSAAGGTPPLKYQWYFNTNTLIANATNATYTLSPIQTSNAGTYSVIVTNVYGSATSSVVTATVLPNGSSAVAAAQWKLAPGSRPYLSVNDTERGLAYDPVLNQLILVSRTLTNGIHILDADTGADNGEIDYSSIAGLGAGAPGFYPINMCGVGDDGTVYVGNLLLSATSDSFSIYSWNGATNTSTISQAYLGNPGVGRLGDTMSVRGAGVNTQILCGFRTGTNVAIFTTTDGTTFTPTIIGVTNLPDSAAGLGLTWGAGNTFWTKGGFNLRHVAYDITNGVGGVIESDAIPINESSVGVDLLQNYVFTTGVSENPQNVAFYDLATVGGPTISSLFDREFFGSNNGNGNGTGAIAVDSTHSRLFALDSNNGIIAVNYAPRIAIAKSATGNAVLSWPGFGTLQSATVASGPYTDVTSTSPYTNAAGTNVFFRMRR